MLQPTQTELCFLCHGSGTTASPFNVQEGKVYNPASGTWQDSSAGGFSQAGGVPTPSIHDIEGYGANQTAYDPNRAGFTGTIPGGSSSLTGRGLQCSSCHNPHGGTGNARLLRNSFFNGVTGRQVRMTTGANKVISYDQGFTEWCAACHGRFNVGAGAGHTGEEFNGVMTFRHPVNVYVDYGTASISLSGTPLQSGKRTSDTADDNLVVCVTCHRSHGTAAAASGYAAAWRRDTDDDRRLTAVYSRLRSFGLPTSRRAHRRALSSTASRSTVSSLPASTTTSPSTITVSTSPARAA
mgnify:CR=1 FL=1